MDVEEIKQGFERDIDQYSGAIIDPGMRGAIIGTLEKACGRKEDRHLVLKFLTGKTSSKELRDAEWNALYLMVKPFKPEGGRWTTMYGEDMLRSVCSAIIRVSIDQPGQMKMFEYPELIRTEQEFKEDFLNPWDSDSEDEMQDAEFEDADTYEPPF